MIKKVHYISALIAMTIVMHTGAIAQNTGIFQTYAVVNANGSGNQFLAGGFNSDGAPTFSGTDFGNVTSLILNGGEVKTFKNGPGDVFGAEISYNVHLSAGATGAFNTINLPFESNLPSPGDQRWQQTLAGVDLLAGLGCGTYDLEVFWRSPTNQGDNFDSNFGANFTATFTIDDTQDPVITCSSDLIVQVPFSQSSATVNFITTATDNCTTTPSVVCSPASGSSFALGTTLVNCTATDDAANEASCSFSVTVIELSENEDCEDAIAITPSAWGYPLWDTLSVSGASESLIGCIGTADDDTWYSWVAQSANDVVIVQDIGASSDMVVEIYDGCGGTSLGCYDNYGTGALERAWVGGLTVGNTYYFRTYDKAVGGPASGEIQVIVKTFAIGAIRDIFCGITDYALSDYFTPERQDFNQLYPYTLVATAGYGVRLTDQVTSTAYVKNQIGGYGTQFFQFSDFSGIPFNTLFDAQARHALNIACNGGVSLLWSEYGPSCTMGLGGVTQTQIRAQYCTGAVDYDLFDLIQADVVPEASQYRFIFRENGNTIIRVKNSYSVFLYDVPGLAYGKTYQVTVQVLVNGVWSEEGTSCSINMLTQPPSTSVRQQYCNGTVLYPSGNYILAEVVAGADLYQWRFTPLGGGLSTYEYTGGYSLGFGPQTDVQGGVTYDVAVRARVQGLWGDFENDCPLTIQPNPGMEAPRDFSEAKWQNETEQLSIYPNPNGGEELMIVLTGLSEEEGTVQLELLDMMGRLVQSERISSKGEQISYKMLFEERLPSGLYLLRASQEGMMLTRRLVIE